MVRLQIALNSILILWTIKESIILTEIILLWSIFNLPFIIKEVIKWKKQRSNMNK